MDNNYKKNLEKAFEILLGKPLQEFDSNATYRLYYEEDLFNEDFFENFDKESLERMQTMSDAESCINFAQGEPSLEFFPNHEGILGESLFIMEEDDIENLNKETQKEIIKASKETEGMHYILGIEFAKIIQKYKINVAKKIESMQILSYIETDGSLFDTMCAATYTEKGYKGLIKLEKGVEIEPKWEKAFTAIEDERLHNHFNMLCLTNHYARSSGAFYEDKYLPDFYKDIFTQKGWEVIAAWSFGEGQAASFVVKIENI